MRALILSGGGAKGAFTIGALKTLVGRNIDNFDIVSGTSTGSLIATLVCNGDFDKLENIYSNVEDRDILEPQNILANFNLKRPYLFDTLPLQRMIDKHVTDEVFQNILRSSTHLCLTAVDLQTGMPTVFTTKAIPHAADFNVILLRNLRELKNALLASSNQAAFLPPVSFPVGQSVHQFVDGGNREVLPTRVVCHLLPKAVVLPPDEVYVLSNNPEVLGKGKVVYTDLIEVMMRAISIFVQDVRENDLARIREHRDKYGTHLFIIQPAKDLDEEYPTGLRFSKRSMGRWMKAGKTRAHEELEQNGAVA